MKEESKREYLEKTPHDELQKSPKIQALSETRTRTLTLVAG